MDTNVLEHLCKSTSLVSAKGQFSFPSSLAGSVCPHGLFSLQSCALSRAPSAHSLFALSPTSETQCPLIYCGGAGKWTKACLRPAGCLGYREHVKNTHCYPHTVVPHCDLSYCLRELHLFYKVFWAGFTTWPWLVWTSCDEKECPTKAWRLRFNPSALVYDIYQYAWGKRGFLFRITFCDVSVAPHRVT